CGRRRGGRARDAVLLRLGRGFGGARLRLSRELLGPGARDAHLGARDLDSVVVLFGEQRRQTSGGGLGKVEEALDLDELVGDAFQSSRVVGCGGFELGNFLDERLQLLQIAFALLRRRVGLGGASCAGQADRNHQCADGSSSQHLAAQSSRRHENLKDFSIQPGTPSRRIDGYEKTNSSEVGGPAMKDTTLFLIIGFAVAISLVPTMRIAASYAANCDRIVPAS